MAITKRAYIDLEGLSAFKTSLLGTVINDSNKTTTNKTATIKAIADYVDSEIGDLSSAITADLAKKVSSVTYDTTNKKFVYNKGGSNTDIVTVATLKSDIGTFVKSGSTASAGLVPAPSTTAGTSKYLREDGTWATPPDTNTTYETATKDTLGLVKSQTTGTTSNRNYGVEVNSDGTMKVNVPWTDTKVTSTASTTTKAYLVGSTSASTNTDTLIKDTNVYLDATAGKLVATTFEGALSGNATTATRATQDSAGQQIDTFYIKGLSVNGKDITYTKGDGKTGTITTQDTTYSTATSSTLGLVKSSTTGKTVDRDYNVEVNSDGTMKVNVPWTNTTSVSATTTGNGNAVTSITASGSAISVTKGATFLTSHQDISGKENISNKVTSWSTTTTDAHYPSEKLVKDSLDSVYSAINNFDYRGRVNTWSAVNTFSNGSDVTSGSSTASGAIIASNGGIWAAGGIRGNRVYNAVWNDLADCIPVDNDCELTPGYCYCFDGEKYYKSSKYLDDGIIGIHSDTYGMHMGYKDNCKQMDVAVAGFVLAYVDKEYPAGTPLTCTENGYLTKIEKSDKIEYPEKIVATYWKNESSEYWGGEKDKIKVNGRKWVKIK